MIARPNRYATQKGIAEALCLAQSTVATALNPATAHKLQPETVARIRAYAEKVGYRPRKFAQIMRGGSSYTIGAVFMSGVYHASQERVKLLAQYAIRASFNLIAVDLNWYGQNIVAAQEYLLDAAVEGVILCNLTEHLSQEWEKFCEEKDLPMVAVASGLGKSGSHTTECDMESAFREMTAHHIAMGSKRLTLLLHVLPCDESVVVGERNSARMRAVGFMKAIAEAGGRVEADATIRRLFGTPANGKGRANGITGNIVYSLSNNFIRSGFEHGKQHMRRMVETGTVPESLVCSNDDIAVGALSYCQEAGIRVPGNLLISGADDAPFASYCGVPLTTVRQPSEKLTEWAVGRLIELIEKPKERTRKEEQIFPCEIIRRKSTLRGGTVGGGGQ